MLNGGLDSFYNDQLQEQINLKGFLRQWVCIINTNSWKIQWGCSQSGVLKWGHRCLLPFSVSWWPSLGSVLPAKRWRKRRWIAREEISGIKRGIGFHHFTQVPLVRISLKELRRYQCWEMFNGELKNETIDFFKKTFVVV